MRHIQILTKIHLIGSSQLLCCFTGLKQKETLLNLHQIKSNKKRKKHAEDVDLIIFNLIIMRLCNESCGQNFIKPCVKYLWIVLGPIMVIGLYSLLILHTYIYFTLIVSPVRMKLGTWPALGWIAIGITLLFNIVFNHILATLIKPNGPRELRQVESLREFYKRRTARKVI